MPKPSHINVFLTRQIIVRYDCVTGVQPDEDEANKQTFIGIVGKKLHMKTGDAEFLIQQGSAMQATQANIEKFKSEMDEKARLNAAGKAKAAAAREAEKAKKAA